MSTRESVEILLDAAITSAEELELPVDWQDVFDPSLLDEYEEECKRHGDPNCRFLRVEAMANYVKEIGKICEDFAGRNFSPSVRTQLSLAAARAQEAGKVIAAAWYIIECADDSFFCDVKHTQYVDDLEAIRRFVMKMRKPPPRT